ncbi:UDP-glucose 4-epimerase [Stenotrophomonas sp. ISL-67]|uniref:NAD-dependent epimerase/dehydratase family protein n=1 Tax=Stenotrophomonas sp. ISL-67 TaxID=2819171 RepID=UPI001BE4E464|nr:NAD-dependent epimerase/dehydratase family protein [Stenotrophomonas sp. ISL-67]MBT2767288.1 UDP-glucose 4-epimerase [Stenotrophomonas sp. ISL-67]
MAGPVLVIGGAGYIGSHIVRHLLAADRGVLVVDDLSTGSPDGVAGSRLYTCDLFSPKMLLKIIAEHGVETVVHAATSHHEPQRSPITVGRSEGAPPLAAIFDDIVRAGVSKLVFTSTCAVYEPSRVGRTVDEKFTTVPLSQYGADKLAVERHLLSLSYDAGLKCVSLRCFNVAGVHRGDGFLGSAGDPSRLINMACEVATGRRTLVPVFVSDCPTTDGTWVRDYVHVDDVARAHVNAVSYLDDGGPSIVLNCGSGHGHSVLEVLGAVEGEAVVPIPKSLLPRRWGKVPFMVADIRLIQETLGWAPRRDSLVSIIRDSLAYGRTI